MKGYVCMPVYRWPKEKEAADENPVGYVGRFPGDNWNEAEGFPRYKLPKDFPKNLVLFGINEALEDDICPYLVVVEGPFSVLRMAAAGHPVVATLGASLSDAQADLLVRTGRRIVIMFDGDQAGLLAGRLAAAKLITRVWTRVVKLDDGIQPDEFRECDLNEMLTFGDHGRH